MGGLEGLRPSKIISFCAALRAQSARSAAQKSFSGAALPPPNLPGGMISASRLRSPYTAQQPQPVAMHHRGDIIRGVATRSQQSRQLLKIGDRVEIERRLLATKAAIEISADRHMAAVASQLADMVDMIDDIAQRDSWVGGDVARSDHPGRPDHPGVERRADHPVARDNRADLLVVELALVRHQRAAVVVAGDHRAAITFERL